MRLGDVWNNSFACGSSACSGRCIWDHSFHKKILKLYTTKKFRSKLEGINRNRNLFLLVKLTIISLAIDKNRVWYWGVWLWLLIAVELFFIHFIRMRIGIKCWIGALLFSTLMLLGPWRQAFYRVWFDKGHVRLAGTWSGGGGGRASRIRIRRVCLIRIIE